MPFAEDEYLQISEIQHFAYCPRQWAIAYMEQQWQENVRTVEGKALHEKAHDDTLKEKRGNIITVRGMPIASRELGICGVCDVVEFTKDSKGISLPVYKGRYSVVPVEYKRGKPKEGEEDVLQLTVQAMCLEEMLATNIPYGFLYYGEIRHRSKVEFTDEFRQHIRTMLRQMREYSQRQYTPIVKKRKGCANCSVRDLCVPRLNQQKSVMQYIVTRISE